MLRLLLILASALSANAPTTRSTTKPAAPPVTVRVQRVDVGKTFDEKSPGIPAGARVIESIETLAVPGYDFHCSAGIEGAITALSGDTHVSTDGFYRVSLDYRHTAPMTNQQVKTTLMLKADEPPRAFCWLKDAHGDAQGDVACLSLISAAPKK